jgi:hypothetical protein
MDPNSGLAILGAAIGSAKVVEKVLGPTAEYLGNGMRDWTDRRVTNVARIFENANKKLGDKGDQEGSVHPKVLREILNNGSVTEDELAAEYFGGVLASSKTGVSRDDRGAMYCALTGRLTTYQIRAHYYFYSLIKYVFDGSDHSVAAPQSRSELELFIPIASFALAMELTEAEDLSTILSHVFWGLSAEGLIENVFNFGGEEYIKKYTPVATGSGMTVRPSALGVELFLWAHGLGHLQVAQFLNSDVTFSTDVKITTLPGFVPTKKRKKAGEE